MNSLKRSSGHWLRIQLPPGTHLSVWASQGDPTVNPEGYKLIQKGTVPGEGGRVSVYPVNSRFHVFTRLSGRPQATEEDKVNIELRADVLKYVESAPIPFTQRDREIQKETFDRMLSHCCE